MIDWILTIVDVEGRHRGRKAIQSSDYKLMPNTCFCCPIKLCSFVKQLKGHNCSNKKIINFW